MQYRKLESGCTVIVKPSPYNLISQLVSFITTMSRYPSGCYLIGPYQSVKTAVEAERVILILITVESLALVAD